MRVAQVAPRGVNAYSGLLASLVELSISLTATGNEVEVWQLHDWPDDNADIVDRLRSAGVALVPITEDRFGAGTAGGRLLGQRHADIVHLHGVFNPTNVRLARALGVPYVVSPHGGYAEASLAFHRWRKKAFQHLFELRMLRRAAAVCALTTLEADQIGSFGFAGRVPVIPNGAPQIEHDLDATTFRRELGLTDEVRLAAFTGRIDVRVKRLDAVVQGVAAATGWHVAFIGGDFREGVAQLRRLAADLDVAERVHLPGPRRGRDLHEALAAADAFLLMSRSEGIPMALLEALATGTPAVVSPEVDAVVPVAEAGWVTSPTALHPLLEMLYDMPTTEWQQRSTEARRLAANYEWSRVANSYAALYGEILDRG
jgi:glycosyltransferase involved in cell wall biosynthesis